MSARGHFPDTHAIEARLGMRLAGLLSEGSQSMPHDIVERLRFAREQAMARAREIRESERAVALRQPAWFPVGMAPQGTVVVASGGGSSRWQRLASVLPLALLVAGLLLIQHESQQELVHAAAEIDSALLADDLPPDAYSDPGFAEFLRTTPP